MLPALVLLRPPPTRGECAPEDRAAILETFAAWNRAYRDHDIDGVMRIFSREAISSMQGGRDLRYDEIRRDYERTFAKGITAEYRPTYEEVNCGNGFAYIVGTYRKIESHDGKETETGRTRSIDVLRRDPALGWQIVRSMFYPIETKK